MWSYPFFIPRDDPNSAPSIVFLNVYGDVHWLKEFFKVELDLINYAPAGIDIVDMWATLNLPDSGLSLAPTPQSLMEYIGRVPGNGGSGSASWIVRGDTEGEYTISADVTGRWSDNNERISKTFQTLDPIKVWAGSAMVMNITANDKVSKGETYYVDFELVNVSDITIYNLALNIDGGLLSPVYLFNNRENVPGVLVGGSRVSIEAFAPGDTLTARFSIVFDADYIREELTYVLQSMFVYTRGGNAVIPVNIHINWVLPPIPSSAVLIYTYDDESNMRPVVGATITAPNGRTWTTDSDGMAFINLLRGYNGIMTISSSGFETVTIRHNLMRKYGLIYLPPIGGGVLPGGSNRLQGNRAYFGMPTITVPDFVTVFGGREYSFSIPGVPIEYEIDEDGKFKLTVGIASRDLFKRENKHLFGDLKKMVDDIRDGKIPGDLAKDLARYDKLESVADAFGLRGQIITNNANLGGWECKLKLVGYAEGTIDKSTGRARITESGIVVSVEPKFSWQQQAIFMAGPVPIPFVYGFEVGLKAELEAQLGRYIENISMEGSGEGFSWDLAGTFTAKFSPSISAGLGIAKVATLNLEIFGGAQAEYKFGKPWYDFSQGDFKYKFEAGLSGTLRTFLYDASIDILETRMYTGAENEVTDH